MTLYIGSDKVKSVYIGNDEVKKIYMGNYLVYKKGPEKTLVFEDSGVTGSANTNYTTQGRASHEVGATGTKIYSNLSSDGYYIANYVISGDFEVEFTFVEGGNTYYPDIAFINTSKVKLWSMDHRTTGAVGEYTMEYDTEVAGMAGEIRNGEKWKVIREDQHVMFYVDGTMKYEVYDAPNGDVKFAWKTHNHSSRWFRFKDLKIYQYTEA